MHISLSPDEIVFWQWGFVSIAIAEQAIAQAISSQLADLCLQIESGAVLTDGDRDALLKIAKTAIATVVKDSEDTKDSKDPKDSKDSKDIKE